MKIRGWILGDGRSIRAVARETGISRTTIKKYLKDPEQPQYRERQLRVGHKLNAQFEARLREFFKHDLQLRRRERRTAKKLYEALVAEGYTGSYSPVQRFVGGLKKSSGTDTSDAFIPLYFAPGDALQFDWSEEYVMLGGVEHKVHVAHFRLCHSRKPFVVAYLNEKQEMVLDAFVRALLFELISQRYERGSTMITSNLPFDEWTETFGTERLTGALLDRLTHHVNILEMNGDSYRLCQSRARKAQAAI